MFSPSSVKLKSRVLKMCPKERKVLHGKHIQRDRERDGGGGGGGGGISL